MYNRNRREFYLADCDIVNEYIGKHCFKKELGYTGLSLIAEVSRVSGIVKKLDIF